MYGQSSELGLCLWGNGPLASGHRAGAPTAPARWSNHFFWPHDPNPFGRGGQGVKDQGSISRTLLEQFFLVRILQNLGFFLMLTSCSGSSGPESGRWGPSFRGIVLGSGKWNWDWGKPVIRCPHLSYLFYSWHFNTYGIGVDCSDTMILWYCLLLVWKSLSRSIVKHYFGGL